MTGPRTQAAVIAPTHRCLPLMAARPLEWVLEFDCRLGEEPEIHADLGHANEECVPAENSVISEANRNGHRSSRFARTPNVSLFTGDENEERSQMRTDVSRALMVVSLLDPCDAPSDVT